MTGVSRRLLRLVIIVVHDGGMAAISFVAALYLRLGQNPLEYSRDLVLTGTPIFTAVAVCVFAALRLHRGVWRYASLPELFQIMRAAAAAILVFLPVMFWLTRLEGLPRSALVINWFILVALLAGTRIAYRMAKDKRIIPRLPRLDPDRIPVLLIGARDETDMFIRAMTGTPGARYQVVGIVDFRNTRVGRQIRGIEVMGGLEDLDEVMDRLTRAGRRPNRLVVTDSQLRGAPMRDLLAKAESFGTSLSRLPRITDFTPGDDSGVEPRPVAIEDLLGRPQQVLDRTAMEALIRGRKVLVTGAGGTIGGELVRQVTALGPSHLTLLDNAEYGLYLADQEIAERAPELPRETVLADVRDAGRIADVIAAANPDLVYHAAALKHVPMVEAHPEEGVLTNAIGTRNVADACRDHGVGAMVLISTDKAVNPASVMGASKRIAESYCQALNVAAAKSDATPRTRFITVRFGNVLGSTGSVVPLFQHQLARGGPLTVTHPDMTRYFMTAREAVELVLEASVLGTEEGASAAIFVLDMGEPIKIVDLARQMIHLAGFEPEKDIRIEITGLRPGEKLMEELFHDTETTQPTRYPGILVARPRPIDLDVLASGIDEIERAARAGTRADLNAALARLAPDYAPGPAARVRHGVT
ncbi:MAG: nucleoside-diphosphate sugar epimerase/dehydratase [Alphaproteobacteria bacterium]|nr:nucleoside-diphosphate sugar epimerase/dehydratase [Alphaproteobacteria bacterium]